MAATEQTSPHGERVSRIEGGYEHLATKADVGRVETDLAQMKSDLKADIARTEAGLKADIARIEAELKADIARQDGQIRGIKWWVLSVGAAITALSGNIELLPLGG